MTAAQFLDALVRSTLGSTLLVALVLLTQWLFRRHLTPRGSCALWLLVMVRLVPVSVPSSLSLWNLLPHANAPEPIAIPLDANAASAEQQTDGAANAALSNESSEGERRDIIGGEIQRTPSSAERWILTAWLAGVLAFGGYVVVSSARVSRRVRRLRKVEDPRVLALLRECADCVGVRRLPVVLEGPEIASPALYGCIGERLLLPANVRARLTLDELRFIFLHELAHLRRRDLLLNWVATCLQILHWFNPFVWFAFSRWRADREIACDALALDVAGQGSNRAYAHTMLRLLEVGGGPGPQPGLVGILETKRELARRLRMIARHQPARRPFRTLVLLSCLSLAGLTDAQVTPVNGVAALSAPPPFAGWQNAVPRDGKHVVIVVSAAETMLGYTTEEVARWRSEAGDRKRQAPKWQRVSASITRIVNALVPGTYWSVITCQDGRAEQAVPPTLFDGKPKPNVGAEALGDVVPAGGFNLQSALTALRALDRSGGGMPDRIVLIVDTLPTSDGTGARPAETDADRDQLFRAAVSQVPSRTAVTTLLLPHFPDNRTTAGRYWQLAHETRGTLVVAGTSTPTITHLALVVDTSGSMRDPQTGGLWPGVLEAIDAAMTSQPGLEAVQIIDGDGRFILGRKGQGAAGWLKNTPETRTAVLAYLRRYGQDTISNPLPGVFSALRFLDDKNEPELRMGILVIGDEFVLDPDVVRRELDELNPAHTDGRRRVTVSAIGFPTTIRFGRGMGNTGLKYAELMRAIASEHGGVFVGLPEL